MWRYRSGRCSRRPRLRGWRSIWGMRRPGARRCGRMRGRLRSRCRMRNAGSGSCIGWRGTARATSFLWRFGLRGGWGWGGWSAPPAARERALCDVVERHESLRTVFAERDGLARQEILEARAVRPSLAVVGVREEELAGVLATAAGAEVALDREPPLRAHLYGLSAREHVLLLVLHHIAGDGWSLGVLLRDIARCYGARRAGEAPGLAPLAVQYADYTLWQQEVLGSESEKGSAISRQLLFWREHLEGLPEQIELR